MLLDELYRQRSELQEHKQALVDKVLSIECQINRARGALYENGTIDSGWYARAKNARQITQRQIHALKLEIAKVRSAIYVQHKSVAHFFKEEAARLLDEQTFNTINQQAQRRFDQLHAEALVGD